MKKSFIQPQNCQEVEIQQVQQFLIWSPIPQFYAAYPDKKLQPANFESKNVASLNTSLDLLNDCSGGHSSERENNNLHQKKVTKRKRSHNACKKVNRFAFNCLQRLTNCHNILILKRFIHRYDFFLVILLVSNTKGLLHKFSQIYSCISEESVKYRLKFEKDLTSLAVEQFFQKTKKSIGQFMRGNLQKAISILYDVDHLKCRTYLAEAYERIKELHGLGDQMKIEEGYSQKRQMKKVKPQQS